MKFGLISLLLMMTTGCIHAPAPSLAEGKPMPSRLGASASHHLLKNDFDRLADIELEENRQSLQILMRKLYKRNPQELTKSSSEPMEQRVDWLFNSEQLHHWQFKDIHNLQDIQAISLAFKPEYTGDRVLPFIVGLHTMLAKAHNNKKTFFLTDSIHPQSLYNVARNIEIAAWKLSASRKPNGALYLLSNESSLQTNNLSFEREFGKMIGRTDLYAFLLAEKSQRYISTITQSLATAVFLPF